MISVSALLDGASGVSLDVALETFRIAVVAAGMQAPDGNAAEATPALAGPWHVTVESLEEAVAVARAGAAGRRAEIVLAAGVHRVDRTVRIGAEDPIAAITGCDGARVVGGDVGTWRSGRHGSRRPVR